MTHQLAALFFFPTSQDEILKRTERVEAAKRELAAKSAEVLKLVQAERTVRSHAEGMAQKVGGANEKATLDMHRLKPSAARCSYFFIGFHGYNHFPHSPFLRSVCWRQRFNRSETMP